MHDILKNLFFERFFCFKRISTHLKKIQSNKKSIIVNIVIKKCIELISIEFCEKHLNMDAD